MIFGEKDVLRVLQLLPGIKSGGEASSGIYVRGGGPDQNLILLDGVPIYNASHLFGFFSTFNSDAISNVTMIKGGFPARYGGRASSVLDMRMKEGNLKDFNV
jgi:outer membrane cobalamin receptor